MLELKLSSTIAEMKQMERDLQQEKKEIKFKISNIDALQQENTKLHCTISQHQ